MSGPSFIEVQFPVSRLSKESYKERKANHGQTLTGLGKWWGRKPLVLVRATILGLLVPASNNPRKDREVFLKLMTMDDDGLKRRRSQAMSQKELYEALEEADRKAYFTVNDGKPTWKRGLSRGDKQALADAAFGRLSYDGKLTYCDRPEHLDGPSKEAWREINAHLGTNATSLPELFRELGERRFGHVPRVGDAFCGGGSIPFEAARIGCDAYGSDLNPVAALLTWASLNIVGGGPEVAQRVQEAQKRVFDAVDKQVTEWGIEHDDEGRRADAYLYCVEVKCPECGWRVPMAPSWVIGERSKAVAVLVPDEAGKRFDIRIEQGVDNEAMKAAKNAGTAVDGLRCPSPSCRGRSMPMAMIRGDRRVGGETVYGLRLWENDDLVPRPEDVFQERLYCIRWVERDGSSRRYAAPTPNDLARERRVLELLQERFVEWQNNGYLPQSKIEPGEKTDEPIRTRGWTHWHHLFNPRQLLVLGALGAETATIASQVERAACLLALGCAADWDSRLCRWTSHGANEKSVQTFTDQAIDPLFNYCTRPLLTLANNWFFDPSEALSVGNRSLQLVDARALTTVCSFWITDPPYGDAVRYDELSEFFLAWYAPQIRALFSEWYADSRRALAVVGSDEPFRQSMVECYRNLARHMPDDGQQVVMFTHQDAGVWADLALILWAAGLRVTAAWCIATETETAMRVGNYVQGTVLLVLRKQLGDETAFIDDLYPQIEDEVRRQLDEMLALDDQEEPNFGDADLQLAAYAAALRVLTRYRRIEDLDVAGELRKVRARGEKSPVEKVIEQAVKVATDFLVPRTFDKGVWKRLGAEERLYLKGLELEAAGEQRAGVYMELARGFGVEEYRMLLGSGQANATRLKTATEFESRELRDGRFGRSLVRAALFATYETARSEETRGARQWLRSEYPEFWDRRLHLVAVLDYLAALGHRVGHWQKDAHAAGLLAGALRNENV